MRSIDAILNPFKVYELRKRILFTIALLAVYRLGVAVPTPGVDGAALSAFFQQAKGTIIGLLDLFSGGAFERFSIFALGIMPYISASIIMSLLQPVVPYLERLAKKEGEAGRKKITQYTRYLTLVIALVQATGMSIWIQSMQTSDGRSFVLNPGLGFHLMAVTTLITGAMFVMWLGEQITERGIGNGASLLIFTSIISRIPNAIIQSIERLRVGEMNIFIILFIIVLGALVTAAVVIMIQGHRKILVQYAKRIVGRKVYGGQATHLPLQVNMAGVIPIIFASSILALPATFVTFFGQNIEVLTFLHRQLNPGGAIYQILMAGFIIFFTYFYIAVIFNPTDVADNMRKYGGFIPGIRPGKPTADYIERILRRITFVGAIFLALIDFFPAMIIQSFKLPFYFGGTCILIVVGVALDTVRQIESHLLMRHYDGFIKKGKIRGRF